MSVALSLFSVLTVVTSVITRISPFPGYYRIIKQKTPGEVQLLPVITFFVNNAALVMYACAIDDYVPLFTTNMFGVCTGTGFVVIFHTYAPDRAYVYKMCMYGLLITAILLLYTILAAVGVTGETRDHEGTVLGWITVLTTVVQFGSPLATMRRVIRTKSNASLPFFMCLMNVVNCSCWVTYSSLKWNPFILAPSIAGVLMGVVQVALWVIYRPRGGAEFKQVQDTLAQSTHLGDSFVIEMSSSHRNNLDRFPSYVSAGGGMFIELARPRKQDVYL